MENIGERYKMTRVYFEEGKKWIDVDFRLTKDEVDYLIRLLEAGEYGLSQFGSKSKFPKLLGKLADIHNFYDDYPLKEESK